MARGEAFVTCPQCGSQSRIPVMALQRNNYHCSRCGNRIPLIGVHLPGDNQGHQPFRSRSKSQLHKRKRH
jgi:DNA-directed RNA polymerase subunit RPC12/RpoP